MGEYKRISENIDLLNRYIDEYKDGDERKINLANAGIVQSTSRYMREFTRDQILDLRAKLKLCHRKMDQKNIAYISNLDTLPMPSSNLETRCLRCHKKGI